MIDRQVAREICRCQEYLDGAGVQIIIASLGLTETQQADLYARCMDITPGYLDVDDVVHFYDNTVTHVV